MAGMKAIVQSSAQGLYNLGWAVKCRHNSQSAPDYLLLFFGQVVKETNYDHREEILEPAGVADASDELINTIRIIRREAFIKGDDQARNKKMNEFLANLESILGAKEHTQLVDKPYKLSLQERSIVVLKERFPGIEYDSERMQNIEVRVKSLTDPPWKVEWK